MAYSPALPISQSAATAASTGALRVWLWSVAVLVFAMVLVGGATRLTEAGLSITEWKPVLGAIPPLSDAAWLAEFEKYKQIPQYTQSFPAMALGDFKFIYWWEWSHRQLGRFVGLVFALPLVWFWWRGAVRGPLRWQLPALLALGGLQGAVGWWMVASGLTGRTEVAPERLMTHLTLAAITLVALVAIATGQGRRDEQPASVLVRRGAGLLVAAILVQIALGALVAGSRAALVHNTWPLMDGALVPTFGFSPDLQPAWRNFFENVTIVQFQHRIGGYVLLAIALWHAWTARGGPGGRRSALLAAMVIAQACIGIATLLLVVPEGRIPIGWALAHQGFAMAVLVVATVHWRRMSRS